MKKPTIEEYWRQLALPWELSSYDRQTAGLGLVEKLATLSREHINQRKETAIKILKPYLKGQTCLDIGCAGGIFPLELLKQGAGRVIGVDVSEEVIREAQKRATAMHLEDRARFYTYTIDKYREYAKTDIDLILGLGILEYLKPELVRDLIAYIKPKGILFSFDEKVYTLKTGLHYFYRLLKKIPYYKKFSRKEMAELLSSCGYSPVKFAREKNNSFVYYLPQAN